MIPARKQSDDSTIEEDALAEFDGLEPALHSAALQLFKAVIRKDSAYQLSQRDIAAAISSTTFRSVLEQEARLNGISAFHNW